MKIFYNLGAGPTMWRLYLDFVNCLQHMEIMSARKGAVRLGFMEFASMIKSSPK